MESAARVAVKAVLGLVFAGWVLAWVVRPTDTFWKKWVPVLSKKAGSSHEFGSEGPNLLIYTLPIIFIAVASSVYLHWQQRRSQNAANSERVVGETKHAGHGRLLWAFWRRPVLVRGPMGVVSAIEVAFVLMFIALVVWTVSISFHTFFTSIDAGTSFLGVGQPRWLAKLEGAALTLGFTGNICLALLFFPITRTSPLLPLVGLSPESSVRYHIWLGHAAMSLFTAHGLGYIVRWAAAGQMSQVLLWPKAGVSNVAGELALLFGLVMWAATLPMIRRKAFEVFFYIHQLYPLFVVFYVLHIGFAYSFTVLPGIFLFLVDRCLRFLQSRRDVRVVSATVLPGDTVELNFAKNPGFHYSAMSSVFINVPSISKLQWHPFTVSSSSALQPETMSVIIKTEGDWTQKLYGMLASPTPVDRLRVSVEGPYGPVGNHFMRYDSLVLVSGGSGITPFISMIRDLVHHGASSPGTPTPEVHLICAFKTSGDLRTLDLLLPPSTICSDVSSLPLRISAFVTRDKAPRPEAEKQLRTIRFRQDGSESAISPALGSNSWLWLGIVVACSFAAFLLLLAILGVYSIYPIDHNTDAVYPAAGRAVLSLFCMLLSVAVVAGAAVLWERKRLDKVGLNQMMPCRDSPPNQQAAPWEYELESFPRESIAHATAVEFGARPNLEKLLLEHKEPNTGLFVSGPAAMIREAAKISSSGRVPNLHFESVSFTW